jgi:20S proteasome alpha/beta subunit
VTVIVALRCPTGIVLATDSQATTQMLGGIPMKLPTRKIERLGPNVVYAGTGGQGAGQRIQAALAPYEAQIGAATTSIEIARIVTTVVNPIQKAILDEWVQLPNSQPEMWGGIFCGTSPDGLWIFEIDIQGPWQFHNVFTATGSGHAVAHAALMNVMHFDVANQSLEANKAIAYRAIETTCTSSAWGVGLPVQLAVVKPNEINFISSGDDAHTELSDLVNLWKAKEVETLGALAPAPSTATPTESSGSDLSIDASEVARLQTDANP